ncbi:hypothetical protein [Pelagibius marinus]|uniref:hypothetical protein n=1 Tax=Pelagibius marinus TaxID=2762760 RepID=UPI001873085B|nr:hypothetical protein [Pelagibius marinus]
MVLVSVGLWLFVAVPIMYFRLLHIDFGFMSIVAWVGLLSLIGGLVMGLRSKRKELLWFFVPFFLGHFYLVFYLGAAFLLQAVSPSKWVDYVSLVFIVFEISILLALLIRLKGARIPAAALSVFNGAYTLVAVGMAYM